MATVRNSRVYGTHHQAATYRSGLEERVAAQLKVAGVDASYEDKLCKLSYTSPSSPHTYLPDFILPNGVIIETKGMLDLADRKKHILIAEQYPSLDLRFVFSNSNAKIRKGSPTSYADWCNANGFWYADKLIPQAWLDE